MVRKDGFKTIGPFIFNPEIKERYVKALGLRGKTIDQDIREHVIRTGKAGAPAPVASPLAPEDVGEDPVLSAVSGCLSDSDLLGIDCQDETGDPVCG